jgi:hypothetical protein
VLPLFSLVYFGFGMLDQRAGNLEGEAKTPRECVNLLIQKCEVKE